ncbi:hypothetical protein HJG60_007992 [Phyllostomus discolor]|uniref:Uncharacterized protein n=1 Tax=Phyllostomus discolor TaxID=89673 RepID=A0A834EVR7_9CHIR|nr:hypothetical protein HJG60_007992 [Phyllostomus discolor]
MKMHLPVALSESAEINSGKGNLDSTFQCLKLHTANIHSFPQQIFMELLQFAIRISSDQVINKADQVLALMELSFCRMRKGLYQKKTNEKIMECSYYKESSVIKYKLIEEANLSRVLSNRKD